MPGLLSGRHITGANRVKDAQQKGFQGNLIVEDYNSKSDLVFG